MSVGMEFAHCKWLLQEQAQLLCAVQGASFGIGALQQEGVWYFAFGANMTSKKLTESRGIKPSEATNGFLPGWRLAFNHKCVHLFILQPK